MSPSITRVAVFDPDAFYPFRSLVNGQLTSLKELSAIEEFLRAIVLHDEMVMELEPFSYSGEEEEWTPEQIEEGSRHVITAIGPAIHEYGLFDDNTGPQNIPNVALSSELARVSEEYAGAGPGNVYYKAHIELLKRLLGIIQNGGSLVCRGPFVRDAIEAAASFPTKMFEGLDTDWQKLASRMAETSFGPLVPPVLGIVLTRSASREKIPNIVRDLRDEWAVARSKVWELTDVLKSASTTAEAIEIVRELEEASKFFSPYSEEGASRPTQILWDLCTSGIGGAAIAGVSGGDPKVGALTGLIAQGVKTIQTNRNFGRLLLSQGAFDLAKRVNREVTRIEFDRLSVFLSPQEKMALGI